MPYAYATWRTSKPNWWLVKMRHMAHVTKRIRQASLLLDLMHEGAAMTVSIKSPPEAKVKASPAETLVRPRASSAAFKAYEQFLEMPVAVVLGVMWLAGATLVGSCALVLYLAVSALI
jgi:hypothetical protein